MCKFLFTMNGLFKNGAWRNDKFTIMILRFFFLSLARALHLFVVILFDCFVQFFHFFNVVAVTGTCELLTHLAVGFHLSKSVKETKNVICIRAGCYGDRNYNFQMHRG